MSREARNVNPASRHQRSRRAATFGPPRRTTRADVQRAWRLINREMAGVAK